ncbi:hypothetical protein [Arthrobacter sp. lap29]|uniref:hypothetical protein n=1 Tax=Arthrobacter sp. lap29 TaxID=3056122 RepID=UPI0028F70EF4|nr:hypothetical protein [Arthrobacter sp. lap29]
MPGPPRTEASALRLLPAFLARIIESQPLFWPGEHLIQAPTTRKFTISASLLSHANKVRVIDSQGKDLAQGSPTLSAEALKHSLGAEIPCGEYKSLYCKTGTLYRIVTMSNTAQFSHPKSVRLALLLAASATSLALTGCGFASGPSHQSKRAS